MLLIITQSPPLPTTIPTTANEIILQVGGRSCAVCTGRVERALLAVPGVHTTAVVLATQQAYVTTAATDEIDDVANPDIQHRLAQRCVQPV